MELPPYGSTAMSEITVPVVAFAAGRLFVWGLLEYLIIRRRKRDDAIARLADLELKRPAVWDV